jgi:hypothetical protein
MALESGLPPAAEIAAAAHRLTARLLPPEQDADLSELDHDDEGSLSLMAVKRAASPSAERREARDEEGRNLESGRDSSLSPDLYSRRLKEQRSHHKAAGRALWVSVRERGWFA